MIDQIREKNRIRIVSAAFKGKFLREPNAAELSHWVAIFQSDGDFQRFLIQITQAAAGGQPLSGVAITQARPTASAVVNQAPMQPAYQELALQKLGARAGFFYQQMQQGTHRQATDLGNI